MEAFDEVERAFVHVDYTKRSEPGALSFLVSDINVPYVLRARQELTMWLSLLTPSLCVVV